MTLNEAFDTMQQIRLVIQFLSGVKISGGWGVRTQSADNPAVEGL